MRVLVIDVGGTHVKMAATDVGESRKFRSGKTLTPDTLVREVRRHVSAWEFDVISLGYPGPVDEGGPVADPRNLAAGWVGFEFERAFERPVRIVNDAVMQALGAYEGGRMLFLGLGTGLGSALISEHVIVPLELGRLASPDGGTMAEWLGREGLERHGTTAWLRALRAFVRVMREAFATQYIVLGGGNAKKVKPLPPGARRGGNDDAFTGGFRLWEEVVEPHDQKAARVWRVVR